MHTSAVFLVIECGIHTKQTEMPLNTLFSFCQVCEAECLQGPESGLHLRRVEARQTAAKASDGITLPVGAAGVSPPGC